MIVRLLTLLRCRFSVLSTPVLKKRDASSPRVALSFAAILPLFGLLWAGAAVALDISPAQMQMIKQLSPAQQQQLLKQYGPQLGVGGGGAAAVAKKPAPAVVTPRPVADVAAAVIDTREEVEAEVKAVERIEQQASVKPYDPVHQPTVRVDLKPFGYDLFAGTPSTFAPTTEVPIPADYRLGPGDVLNIQLLGKDPAEYKLVVSRNGAINFPKLGPVYVAGQTLNEVRQGLEEKISSQFIGVKSYITLGELRSIRVFVLGEAYKPGAYSVSALSTISNGLFVSGGVKTTGSLRNIQLKRQGELVGSLDLYDFLLKGDTRSDLFLREGDVIFIPPATTSVSIAGDVTRPAIYELKQEKTVGELLRLAGGLNNTAFKEARLERVGAGKRSLLALDVGSANGRQAALQDGDYLYIPSISNLVNKRVTLAGHVYRPGDRHWQQGMRVSDLVASAADLKPQPDLDVAILVRESPEDGTISLKLLSLRAIFNNPKHPDNRLLQDHDRLDVLSLSESRIEQIKPVLATLQRQPGLAKQLPEIYRKLERNVRLQGHVRQPGSYPRYTGMRVSDLVVGIDALQAQSDLEVSMLVRKSPVDGTYSLKLISLEAIFADPSHPDNMLLMDNDRLDVFSLGESRIAQIQPVLATLQRQPGLAQQLPEIYRKLEQSVSLKGHVRYPGTYPWYQGMRVSDLVVGIDTMQLQPDLEWALLKRIRKTDKQFELHLIDLRKTLGQPEAAENVLLEPQDVLTIFSLAGSRAEQFAPILSAISLQTPLGEVKPVVEIHGNIQDPGRFPYIDGMTLDQLYVLAKGYQDDADAYPLLAAIERFDTRSGTYKVEAFNPVAAIFGAQPMPLLKGDKVYLLSRQDVRYLGSSDLKRLMVYGAQSGDCGALYNLTQTLTDQKRLRFGLLMGQGEYDAGDVGELQLSCPALFAAFPKLVTLALDQSVLLSGEVRNPGIYPLSEKVTVKDLLTSTGGITGEANLDKIEVTSSAAGMDTTRYLAFSFDQAATVEIVPGSLIRVLPSISDMEYGTVSLRGAFTYPGDYHIRKGETLSQVIERAGGLTAQAYPYGAVFTRRSAQQHEQRALDRASEELRNGLFTALSSGRMKSLGGDAAAPMLSQLLGEVSAAKTLGRVVVEADPRILAVRPELDMVLEVGDSITMPKRSLTVHVSGQLLNPGTLQFQPGLRANDYIKLAGGLQQAADDARAFMVLPNGTAEPLQLSFWNYSDQSIPPGTSIIVPRDPTPFDGIVMTQAITDIFSKLAVTAASLAVINN